MLLITNRKLYTGSQWAVNSMTLDDLEGQNRGFYGFFGDFGLRDTFQEQIAPKSIEIDKDKLHTKFSALSIKFRRSKSRFSRFKETCERGH